MDLVRLRSRLSQLYVPAVADILDDMGYTEQVMKGNLRPLYSDVKLCGPAVTVSTYWYSTYRRGERNIESLAAIFDSCYNGCVVVVACGGNMGAACWGELMSNAARARGAVGAVVDGAIRDVPKILEINPPFQVYSAGFTPADSKGRVEFSETEVEIVCGGVRIRPGDIVYGDYDGVVVIPKQVVWEVLEEAEKKVEKEAEFRKSIRQGMNFREAVQRYKVV
jgi:regulator of RNase E activity RraA